jgi:hypothetical protein
MTRRRAGGAGLLGILWAAGAALGFEGRVVLKATGEPVAGAEVTVLTTNATQITSSSGTFFWEPTPVAPFEVLVVLPAGRYMRPFLVTSVPPGGPVVIAVEPLTEESIIVTAGAAPTIEATPANGTTIVPKPDIQSRQPFNLTQTVENVAGVSSVSERALAARLRPRGSRRRIPLRGILRAAGLRPERARQGVPGEPRRARGSGAGNLGDLHGLRPLLSAGR